MQRARLRQVAGRLAKWLIYVVAALLLLAGLALLGLETGWSKRQIRSLIVRQANQYLTATLEIGALEGSLLRGVALRDVRLTREGQTIVAIERVALSYSIRELLDQGVTIRRIRVVRPRVVGRRQPDGRWNLAALVKRDAREGGRRGPPRPIHILSIEVVDGDVRLLDQLNLAFARAPGRYAGLNASLSFDYEPVEWRMNFANAAWNGDGADLTMNRLTGVIANGDRGLSFDGLVVETPRSAFTVTGRVVRGQAPTSLDLHVKADRFAFQEWTGLVGGLRNIAVEASFDVQLRGPLDRLATDLTLQSNAGSVAGAFVLNTRVRGSHGAGAVEVGRLNLARWLNRPNRPSDISGRVAFDLDLQLGQRGGFPRGPYTFEGSHARFMEYEATGVRARGRLTPNDALIAEAIADAYGAQVRIASGSIGISSPYPYRFQGVAERVDLRKVPSDLPVPHVESLLSFEYDVMGQFAAPVIAGRATFADSEFLGAKILAGTAGTIEAGRGPIHYAGDGPVIGVNLQRFARELDIGWLQDSRYTGTVAGRFNVEGTGTAAATMTLKGGGRLARADLFNGTLSDADVSIEIAGGSLGASYDGRLDRINPAIALQDERFAASLRGSGAVRVAVTDLLVRDVEITDYLIDGNVSLERSTARGVPVDSASASALLAGGALTVRTLDVAGPAITGHGTGSIGLTEERPIDFTYEVAQADLAQLKDLIRRDASGQMATKGQASGTPERLRLVGKGTIAQLSIAGVNALTGSGEYDATIPTNDPARSAARVSGEATFVELFDQTLRQAAGTVTYDAGRIQLDLALSQSDKVSGKIAGALVLYPDRRSIDLSALTLTLQNAGWQLLPAARPPSISWDEGGIALTQMTFVNAASATQRVDVAGTWRKDGRGALNVTGRGVFLDTLTGMSARPAIYGGVLDVDATVSGTTARPTVTARVTVTEGRVRRLTYERLAGRVDYGDNFLKLDLRLDQAPGIWLTAAGTVPLGLFDRTRPDGPIDVAIASSSVGLGLIEAVTDGVREVTGTLQLNVRAVGTSRDPQFAGDVKVQNAEFTVSATGVRYRNGAVALQLGQDRVTVEQFHLEDARGRSLELRGSLGTRELQIGDLEIDVNARRFAVLRNEFGAVDVDANLSLRGVFDRPRVIGTVTVVSGELNVDSILDRTLFRPYATEAATTAPGDVDALAALNPWDRLGLDVELRVPNTIHMTGENVQVAAGTPLGLSTFNLRVLGDLYLFKDPGQPLYVTGSFDSVTGNYSFQGRRFDLDPASSINFRGDLNPEIYVTVSRLISGVEARVTIAGPLREPELRLASTPPLESSDILSLIVFGTSTNELNAAQQQELAVRAGTLAAGFLATPLVTALERTLGLEILEIQALDEPGGGARVTVGDELAPGLVARFSRQFGRDEYDEATIEYHLSRMFRVRATFSDAGALLARSPFRRVERAGIDFLLFFSF